MSRLWYVTTAVHMWRFYFRYINADPEKFTKPSQMNWEACDRAIKIFSDFDRELLRQYYTTSYGNYEDMKAISNFASMNDIERSKAWETIKLANYEVIVQRGLMDRREVKESAEHAQI